MLFVYDLLATSKINDNNNLKALLNQNDKTNGNFGHWTWKKKTKWEAEIHE